MVQKYVNTRSSALREELRTLVMQSRPGTKLPSENALVSKYGVARMTAGKALRELEAEGLIERRRGSGTFVKGKRLVTLLLPCPDFLDVRFSPYNCLYLPYLQGALRAVTERGMSLEMIAVSPTNNSSEINYSLLADLNAGSMVICTTWFHMLYDLLTSRGVRVALLGEQRDFYGYRQYHRFFYIMDADRKRALPEILNYYYRHGKRRIALAGGYFSQKDHPLRVVYQEWCQTHEMPELLYTYPELDSEAPAYPDGFIAKLYQQDAFDVLIIHHIGFPEATGSIQDFLGLPASVEVFGFEFNFLNSPNLKPFPTCTSDARQMAYSAVAALDEMPPRGTVRNFPYEFHNLPEDWQDDLKDNPNFSNQQTKE